VWWQDRKRLMPALFATIGPRRPTSPSSSLPRSKPKGQEVPSERPLGLGIQLLPLVLACRRHVAVSLLERLAVGGVVWTRSHPTLRRISGLGNPIFMPRQRLSSIRTQPAIDESQEMALRHVSRL
jgi:hypothetical protein